MHNKLLGLLGLVFAGLFLAGCAAFQTSTTQTLPVIAQETPPSDKAMIIVDGTDSFGGIVKLYAAGMYDNQTFVGKVGPHGRLAWLRNPGRMDLSINHAVSRRATVLAGKTYHYKLNCGSDLIYSIDDLMSLESLLAVRATAATKPDVLRAVEANESLVELQKAVDTTSDPEIKSAAHLRLANLQEEQREADEKLDANWGKLRTGMTYDQVDAFLAINDPQMKDFMAFCKDSLVGPNGEGVTLSAPSKHLNPPYRLHFVNCQLVDWSK